MTELLLKLFVENHENTADPAVHAAVGSLAGLTGIVCNCLLALVKLVTGLLVGSVAIVADAVNNLSDAGSSVVTLLGFRLARRPADKEHPYGHARYEYLSGLVVSALILLIGAELVKSSARKIMDPEPIEISAATFGVLLVSIAVKLWMSGFFRKLGKKIDSSTLQATSLDSRNDVIATAAVLLGCAVNYLFKLNVDGYVGLAVAAFILYSGVNIAKDTISPLLGKQADEELIRRITDLVLSHKQIIGIHDLLIHDYGPGQCYASLHAEMCASEDPLVCHDIIDDIECDVLTELNVHLVIHYDPVLVDDEEWNEMREQVSRIIQGIDPRLSMHDFRVVKGANQKKLVFDLAVPYEMKVNRRDLKKRIDDALAAVERPYPTLIRFDEKE